MNMMNKEQQEDVKHCAANGRRCTVITAFFVGTLFAGCDSARSEPEPRDLDAVVVMCKLSAGSLVSKCTDVIANGRFVSDARQLPAPGSKEALSQGCECSAHFNHDGLGQGRDGSRFGWLVNLECPLHRTSSMHDRDGTVTIAGH